MGETEGEEEINIYLNNKHGEFNNLLKFFKKPKKEKHSKYEDKLYFYLLNHMKEEKIVNRLRVDLPCARRVLSIWCYDRRAIRI